MPTNEEKRVYINSRISGKPVTSDDTAYLNRLYNRAKADESQGLKSTLKGLRGKEPQPWKHVDRRGSKLAKFVLDPNFSAIKRFANTTTKKFISLGVEGIAKEDSPKRRNKRDTSKPIWLGMADRPIEFIKDAIEAVEEMVQSGEIDSSESLTAFTNFIADYGQEWESVQAIYILDS